MRPFLRYLGAAAIALAALACAGCAGEEAWVAEPAAPLAVVVAPLEGVTLDGVESYRICGEATVQASDGSGETVRLFDRTVSAGESVTLKDIPANSDYSVTVVGLAGGAPELFGRAHDVSVLADQTRVVDMRLAPYNEVLPISVDKAALGGKPSPRLFSASVLLPDGRVFVSGGFAGYEGGDDPRLTAASDRTFFFDPATGEFIEGPLLEAARGGHAMVYVPSLQQVVVIGGAAALDWSPETGDLALGFAQGVSLGSSGIEIVDLSGENPTVLSGVASLNPPRVFPQAVLLGAEEVVITGGGNWHELDPGFEYKKGLIFNAKTQTFDTGFPPEDNVVRVAHSMNSVGTFLPTSADSSVVAIDVHLLWGGTRTGTAASLLKHTRKTNGTANTDFASIALEGDTPERTFFHATAPLSGERFLVTGGIAADENEELSRMLGFAYLLSYVNDADGERLVVEAQPGLGDGRIFHTATSPDGIRAAVLGGFGDPVGSTAPSSGVGFALSGSGGSFLTSTEQPEGGLVPRAGASVAVMGTDALHLFGGVSDVTSELVGTGLIVHNDVLVPSTTHFCEAPQGGK